MKRIGMFGCGTLAGIIADGILESLSGSYEVIGVCDVNREAAESMAARFGCPAFTDIEELLSLGPELVIEATAGPVLKRYAERIIRSGADLLPLSVGAFADGELLTALEKAAEEEGRVVHIPSGAIGGFDLMGAGMAAGGLKAEIMMEKPPRALLNSSYFKGTAEDTEPREVFEGSAEEAIEVFPKNVNVAVALGLATVGPENARIRIRSNPALGRNRHTVSLEGNFGKASVIIEAAPSANPSSSALAAYSVLALLKRMASAIQIG